MSRKTVIAIVGWIVTATVIAGLMAGAWWLWQPPRTVPVVDWNAPDVAAMLAGSLAVLLLAIWWLWWRLPKRQVRGLDIQIHDPKARADTEDNFRKTIGQALGGTAVLIGAGAAYLQFTQQQQASQDQLRAAHDLLISTQVSKGFEQLASGRPTMQLGGIYALEGVMNSAPEYRPQVLEALCAFVRDNARGEVQYRPATAVQAALTVIGRRKPGPGNVSLAMSGIRGTDLRDAYLVNATFSDGDLDRADLSGADLSGAILLGAILRGTNLHAANLAGADLRAFEPDGALWIDETLKESNLSDANLDDADLTGADLNKANLNGTHLTGTNLSDVRNLSQEQLAADIVVLDMANDYVGRSLDPIQSLMVGTARRRVISVFVAGRIVVENGLIPGFDMEAAHAQAQLQFDGLVRRYPDRTWGHPPVEAIFSSSYRVIND